METVYTDVIKAIIALATCCATAFLIPWLKTKVDATDIETIERLARIAVYAAEQLYSTDEWEQKKLYAQKYLQDRGYNVDLQEVDAAIEAAVLALHRQIKEGAA